LWFPLSSFNFPIFFSVLSSILCSRRAHENETHCRPLCQSIVVPSLLPSESDWSHGCLPPSSVMRFIAWVSLRKLAVVGSESLSSVSVVERRCCGKWKHRPSRRSSSAVTATPSRRRGTNCFNLPKQWNRFNLALCCYVFLNKMCFCKMCFLERNYE